MFAKLERLPWLEVPVPLAVLFCVLENLTNLYGDCFEMLHVLPLRSYKFEEIVRNFSKQSSPVLYI